MSRARKFALIAALTFTQFALCQSGGAPLSRQPGGSAPEAGTVNPAPQSSLIRILTPVASQKLSDNFTSVRFELVSPTAYAGTPNFLIQMDGNDPIATSQTQQAFTGLAAGAHTVTVQMVDANGTPVPGGRAAIQFFVATPNANPAGSSPQGKTSKTPASSHELKLGAVTFQQPDPKVPQDDSDLPPASSPLPLISIIGFGILVGGIVSAMKTRS
jgi:hypothetical protein